MKAHLELAQGRRTIPTISEFFVRWCRICLWDEPWDFRR